MKEQPKLNLEGTEKTHARAWIRMIYCQNNLKKVYEWKHREGCKYVIERAVAAAT